MADEHKSWEDWHMSCQGEPKTGALHCELNQVCLQHCDVTSVLLQAWNSCPEPQPWELGCGEEPALCMCSKEMDLPKEPGLLCLSMHEHKRGHLSQQGVLLGCFCLVDQLFSQGKQGGWSHPAAQTGPQTSPSWPRKY